MTRGSEKCVLAGDWLYMQAFRVALEEHNLRVLDLLIGLTQQMVEGELLQLRNLGKPISEGRTTTLIFRNTACLFRGLDAPRGAAPAGATSDEKPGRRGRAVGLAFQIVDDVLDLRRPRRCWASR